MTETSAGFMSTVGLPSELLIRGCFRPMSTAKVKNHRPDANNIGEVSLEFSVSPVKCKL